MDVPRCAGRAAPGEGLCLIGCLGICINWSIGIATLEFSCWSDPSKVQLTGLRLMDQAREGMGCSLVKEVHWQNGRPGKQEGDTW